MARCASRSKPAKNAIPQTPQRPEGSTKLHRKDFRDLFDPEVEKITTLIHRQIDSLKAKYANRDIVSSQIIPTISMQSLILSQNYIVLSGGLGSSAYLRTRLQSAFESTKSHSDLQILVSEEP